MTKTISDSAKGFKPGFILFATGDSPEGSADARAWLADKKLTPNQVRLFSLDGMVLVQAKTFLTY